MDAFLTSEGLLALVTLTFLEVNGFHLDMTDDEKSQLMIDISSGTPAGQVAEMFRRRIRRLE